MIMVGIVVMIVVRIAEIFSGNLNLLERQRPN